jgi:hypothetical protein
VLLILQELLGILIMGYYLNRVVLVVLIVGNPSASATVCFIDQQRSARGTIFLDMVQQLGQKTNILAAGSGVWLDGVALWNSLGEPPTEHLRTYLLDSVW